MNLNGMEDIFQKKIIREQFLNKANFYIFVDVNIW